MYVSKLTYMYICMYVHMFASWCIEHTTIRYFCCLLTYVKHMILYPGKPLGALCRSIYDVPDVMIEVIQSLHGGMSAAVTVDGERSELFLVQNGLCQDSHFVYHVATLNR